MKNFPKFANSYEKTFQLGSQNMRSLWPNLTIFDFFDIFWWFLAIKILRKIFQSLLIVMSRNYSQVAKIWALCDQIWRFLNFWPFLVVFGYLPYSKNFQKSANVMNGHFMPKQSLWNQIWGLWTKVLDLALCAMRWLYVKFQYLKYLN